MAAWQQARFRKFTARGLIALVSTVGALGLVEFGSWLVLEYRPRRTGYVSRTDYRSQHPAAYAAADYFSREFVLESATAVRGMEFISGANYCRLGDVSTPHFHIEGNIRRTTDQPLSARRRVWLFGGSTVFCQEVPDHLTIASHLQRLLNEGHAETWRVENLGTPSVSIAQQFGRLRDTAIAPGDVVVFYDGFNDVWHGIYNGNPGGWTTGKDRDGGVRQLTVAQQHLFRIYARFGRYSAAVRLLCDIEGQVLPRNLVDDAVLADHSSAVEDIFLKTLREAHAWCQKRQARFIHFTQPHVFTLEHMTATERWLADNELKLCPGLDRAFVVGHPRVQSACRRAVAEGICCLDISDAFDDRPDPGEIFLDHCHVNHAGNRLAARRIYDLAFSRAGPTEIPSASAAEEPITSASIDNVVERGTKGDLVDYNRDVKPILAAKCFACHGPGADADAGRLRLDSRPAAIKKAIVPGDAAASPLMGRISSRDAEEIMPPSGGNRTVLTAGEVDLLRRWIDEGASYEGHWAFSRPIRPGLPGVRNGGWAINAIDAFVAAAHEAHGLAPAPVADRMTLIRRLSFDLLGLPPPPDDVDDFVADARPDGYERAVDRLLSSARFGERMAVHWLDLVRYADTEGYSKDHHREVWMYRDFVVDSFNANKPFNRFTTQQLAGDLGPEASREERAGSGYNRLLMTSQEGCADPREYTHRYAADRVRNVSSVWLAVTLGCAECHDHKFDPFAARDFYRFAALFADIQETAVGPQEVTRFADAAQEARLEEIGSDISRIESELSTLEERLSLKRADWETQIKTDRVAIPAAVATALAAAPETRDARQKEAVTDYFRATVPQLSPLHQSLVSIKARRDELLRVIPASLVSAAAEPRTVRVLPRGNWADTSGEVVTPGLPACLEAGARAGQIVNRLDLASWLTARDNPLVARVFVNRLWKIAFGTGLVPTADDFGTRGAPPTNQELLDWLAVEFIESGWDVKAIVKLIVMSQSYRQSSDTRPELFDVDPENKWLVRQNRFRLDAEFIRDDALAISGLLSPKIGGPSVRPHQPDGFWAPRFSEKEYHRDSGDDLYRRGLYTYWCRNYLHPALQVFDAPARVSCTAARSASATPLQALALLNDPASIEAARALAARILREAGPKHADRLNFAFCAALSRAARPEEIALLTALLQKHRDEFAADREAALAVVGAGDPAPGGSDCVEWAAWTSVARVILNLYETITRK